MTIAERVTKGAELLDVKRPRWFLEIDLGLLNMANSEKCILGQLYDYYDDVALYELGIIWGGEYGFDICIFPDEYSTLHTLWIKEITKRKAAL